MFSISDTEYSFGSRGTVPKLRNPAAPELRSCNRRNRGLRSISASVQNSSNSSLGRSSGVVSISSVSPPGFCAIAFSFDLSRMFFSCVWPRRLVVRTPRLYSALPLGMTTFSPSGLLTQAMLQVTSPFRVSHWAVPCPRSKRTPQPTLAGVELTVLSLAK